MWWLKTKSLQTSRLFSSSNWWSSEEWAYLIRTSARYLILYIVTIVTFFFVPAVLKILLVLTLLFYILMFFIIVIVIFLLWRWWTLWSAKNKLVSIAVVCYAQYDINDILRYCLMFDSLIFQNYLHFTIVSIRRYMI